MNKKILIVLMVFLVGNAFADGGGGLGFSNPWQPIPQEFSWSETVSSDSGTYYFNDVNGVQTTTATLYTASNDDNKLRVEMLSVVENTCDLFAVIGGQEFNLTADTNFEKDVIGGEPFSLKAVQRQNNYGNTSDCSFTYRLWKR